MIEQFLNLSKTAIELGLICSLTVLALFLSYRMLNICDLSTDGCFTLGACVGGVVALAGHPYLSIVMAMFAGILSGLLVALLQTKLKVDSLLSGIVVNTGLYSINIAIMSGSSILNLNKTDTVFTITKELLNSSEYYKLVVALFFVILVVTFLSFFLKTKLGLAIRATGNNEAMVKTSSLNPDTTKIVGLCIANSFTALSGCLLAQSQKSVDINIGGGMLTVALASLLIGSTLFKKSNITFKAIGAVLGAIIFRIVYMLALRLNMPAYMLRLVSSVIVVIAVSIPYINSKLPDMKRRLSHHKEAR